ncbi:hypothetical protein ACFQ3Z_46055 [Streptomyces nogalater]
MTTIAMTQALERDALVLLAEYDAGSWRPTVGEHLLAEGLARSPGTAPSSAPRCGV